MGARRVGSVVVLVIVCVLAVAVFAAIPAVGAAVAALDDLLYGPGDPSGPMAGLVSGFVHVVGVVGAGLVLFGLGLVVRGGVGGLRGRSWGPPVTHGALLVLIAFGASAGVSAVLRARVSGLTAPWTVGVEVVAARWAAPWDARLSETLAGASTGFGPVVLTGHAVVVLGAALVCLAVGLAAGRTPSPPVVGIPVQRRVAPRPARVSPPGPDLPTDRYRPLRKLGQGGFGSVWLAVDGVLGRRVAVKSASVVDAETQTRIRREARALAAVTHPNCVRVHDIVPTARGLCLVMEYIDGAGLDVVVRRDGPLDAAASARLWITMADALSCAHARGVLHRDVKPSNVLIDASGHAHLIDFGIARSTGDSTLTSSGVMIGTPDFMAYEVAGGAPSSVAADTWQLAATVAYAVTGRPPRGRWESATAALVAAVRGEPARLPGDCPHHDLLTAALDPDPANRPTLADVRSRLAVTC